MVSNSTPQADPQPTTDRPDCPEPPPISGGRNLIVSCDGTSNTADRRNVTNVVRLHQGLAGTGVADVPQLPFYDEGVGTKGGLDAITGGAFGYGMQENVEQAYRFLVRNYQPGDRIYLFGFSRGAFTARSVAGFIRQCSIIRAEHEDRVSKGYKLYRNARKGPDHPDAIKFQNDYSHPMPLVEFVGVWDTVGALGIPANRIIELIKQWTIYKIIGRPKRDKSKSPSRPRRFLSLPRSRHAFHDMSLTSRVKNAYHALAIDEKRPVFTPSIWLNKPGTHRIGETDYCQEVHQSWFPGDHSDVGGGNSNTQNSSVPLEWMATAAEAAGLRFTPEFWTSVRSDASSPTRRVSDSPPSDWRRFGTELRDLSPGPSGTECIHASAKTRQSDPAANYAPQNLADSTLDICK